MHNQLQFCTECGRYSNNNCIHQYNFSVKEIITLIILIMNIPVAFYLYQALQANMDAYQISFFKVGNYSLAFILVVFTAFEMVFRKPYLALFFGCHQQRDRTITSFRKPFFLCARCHGIFLGIFLSLSIVELFELNWWYLLLSAPLILDGLLQRYIDYKSNNLKRLITGLLFSPTLVICFSFAVRLYFFPITKIVKYFIN